MHRIGRLMQRFHSADRSRSSPIAVYPGRATKAVCRIPVLDIESLDNVVAVDLLVHLVYRHRLANLNQRRRLSSTCTRCRLSLRPRVWKSP